jgi:hypothetical protein
MKQYIRFWRVSAWPKPKEICANRSMMDAPL